jgi:hypothetical protein
MPLHIVQLENHEDMSRRHDALNRVIGLKPLEMKYAFDQIGS